VKSPRLKDTKIKENFNVQFRAEFFNLLNHANFGIPSAGNGGTAVVFTGSGAVSPTTGQITTTSTTSRQIQLGLKILF
jgi:hypothetical protein